MTVKTMGPRDAGYIVREVGPISRESGTVKEGETLTAGQIIALDGDGKIVAHDGELTEPTTDEEGGALATPVAGIVMVNVDASATGADGDVPNVTYTARLTEVRGSDLLFPDGPTDGSGKAAIVADLARKFIILR